MSTAPDGGPRLRVASPRIRLSPGVRITADPPSTVLTVMTANVRGPRNTGPAAWENRRELLARVIAESDADVVGTQELRAEQGDDLVRLLGRPIGFGERGYRWFGRDRRGGHDDEHMGILFRRDRVELLDSDDFWLSDTPEVVASQTWGNAFPRMVTWGRFRHLTSGREFLLANTHLPYRPEDDDARERSATLITDRMRRLSRLGRLGGRDVGGIPTVLTGDFNTAPDGTVHRLLSATLTDVHDGAPHTGPEGTFHGFTGQPGERIDWILQSGFVPLSSATVTTHEGDVWPSDHLPVVARLAWR